MTTDSANEAVTVQISLDWFKLASIGLTCVGLFSAFQLAWLKLTHTMDVGVGLCPVNSGMGCESVVSSTYAQIGPLPVVYLGVAGYLVILIAVLFEVHLPFAKFVVLGLTLFGVLFSGYLTAKEAFVLHVWCQLCILNALAMTSLFVVSLIRVWFSVGTHEDDDEPENAIP